MEVGGQLFRGVVHLWNVESYDKILLKAGRHTRKGSEVQNKITGLVNGPIS